MSSVSITGRLPIIRTSVDHGVAFGKAGECRANEEGMSKAIKKPKFCKFSLTL